MLSLIALLGVGCAGSGGATAEPAMAPPAGSPLAKVTVSMSEQEVREFLGAPDNSNSYMTGKAWIPYNFGAGDKSRTDWMYKGQGRVVFTQNQWNGRLSVIKVLYNPDEMM
jgi:hypothetical protein